MPDVAPAPPLRCLIAILACALSSDCATPRAPEVPPPESAAISEVSPPRPDPEEIEQHLNEAEAAARRRDYDVAISLVARAARHGVELRSGRDPSLLLARYEALDALWRRAETDPDAARDWLRLETGGIVGSTSVTAAAIRAAGTRRPSLRGHLEALFPMRVRVISHSPDVTSEALAIYVTTLGNLSTDHGLPMVPDPTPTGWTFVQHVHFDKSPHDVGGDGTFSYGGDAFIVDPEGGERARFLIAHKGTFRDDVPAARALAGLAIRALVGHLLAEILRGFI